MLRWNVLLGRSAHTVRGQTTRGAGFLLPPWGAQGSNSVCQVAGAFAHWTTSLIWNFYCTVQRNKFWGVGELFQQLRGWCFIPASTENGSELPGTATPGNLTLFFWPQWALNTHTHKISKVFIKNFLHRQNTTTNNYLWFLPYLVHIQITEKLLKPGKVNSSNSSRKPLKLTRFTSPPLQGWTVKVIWRVTLT